MPHFRNFHGTTFMIDAETITANKYDDILELAGTGNDTINADKGDDELFFSDELAILVQDGEDELYLKAPTGNDTINADEPVDELFDLNGFGETPPLEMNYELKDNISEQADSFFDIYVEG